LRVNNHLRVGKGPHKIIALHGWFGSAASWGPYATVLDEQRFSYAFMDYRGYGGAKSVKGEFTMQEIAADALALADALGWERFSLIGHSMGGKAVQQVLAEAPARVQKLVALTPVPASGVPFDDAGWKLFSAAAASAEARKGIINFSTGGRLSDAWLDRMVKRSLENSTPQAVAAYLLAWAKGDFSARIKANPVPVLVMVGEHDPALNAEAMRGTFMQWYPNARLETIANAGHYPMEETPVALATAVERFLSA
jgi:pimeloyl-ACP methyl ester carboxylesterase